jgi:hypothetical protein
MARRDVSLPMISDNLLLLFFALIPFAYAAQVRSGSPMAAAVPYLFLLAALFLRAREWIDHPTARRPNLLAIGFGLLILHNLIFSLHELITGEPGLTIRALVLFTLPMALFWLVQMVNQETILRIFAILALGAVAVSLELDYENICTQIFHKSAPFQLLNKDYVAAVTGYNLTQLYLIFYRPTGLLEHSHATTFFITVGLFTSTFLHIYRGRLHWLACALLCAIAVVMHGTRLPLVAIAVAGLTGTVVFAFVEKRAMLRRRALIAALVLILVCLLVLLVDPTGAAHKYYWPALFHGNFQLPDTSPNKTGIPANEWATTDEWITSSIGGLININLAPWHKLMQGQSGNLVLALFGHGITGTLSGRYPFSDDLFILALPLQYGLLGIAVFFGVWIACPLLVVLVLLRKKEIDKNDRLLLCMAFAALIVLGTSMLHSGVLQRKATFPIFPLAAGVIWRIYQRSGTTGSANASAEKQVKQDAVSC